jgi:hypothetical protein
VAAFGPLLLLAACAAEGRDVILAEVPHVRQRPDFCGEACAEMWLRKLGRDVGQDAVFHLAGVDPAEGRGCRTPELARALKGLGFEVGPVWHRVEAPRAKEQVAALWGQAVADLGRGVPSIVCMRCAEDGPEHFRLLMGWRAATDEAVYHEPAEDRGAYRGMKRSEFLDLWPLKYEGDTWTVVRIRLEPPADLTRVAWVKPPGFTRADYCQRVMEARRQAPAGFTVLVEPPFVVAGDEPPEALRRRSEYTIRWASEKLMQDYFAKPPEHVIVVWLFKDDAGYRKHTREVFGDKPTTPFGYYSSHHRALIMNIGTGGGTLVHEMVHPFMRSNFPTCPDWFNEGLASLYEQCREKDGRIHGLTNWRLAGLQQAIRRGGLPSFRDLTAGDGNRFYEKDPGTNYAQARYLCYYLQEHDLLRKFYHAFVANAGRDPTGYETLGQVLGEEDVTAFQKRWEKWVLTLRFP